MANFIGGENGEKKKKTSVMGATNETTIASNADKTSPVHRIKPNTHESDKSAARSHVKKGVAKQSKAIQQNNNEQHNADINAYSTNVSMDHSNTATPPVPPQLVPIHIPFFKWEINVDTLVRVFIFA